MTATVYAIYHRACNHIAAAPNDRPTAESVLKALHASGQHQWRIRVANDADLLALVMGARCSHCTQDGEVTA